MPAHNAAATARPKHVKLTHEIQKGIVELSPELLGRAKRMARSPIVAEDLVQDTVERAIRFQSRFQPGTNFRAWVNQILFSVFITRCRRARREREALDTLSIDPYAWTVPEWTPADSTELSPSMTRALMALPSEFRSVIVLVDLEELSYKNAARRLGVPLGTVMSRLHRGRKMLAESVRASQMSAESAAQAA